MAFLQELFVTDGDSVCAGGLGVDAQGGLRTRVYGHCRAGPLQNPTPIRND